MTRRSLFAALALLALSLPALSQNNDPKTLRVALLPDENGSTIIQNAQPLKQYLEKTLQRNVELIVTTDYSSMIEAMRFGRIEVAYFGPLSYVLAKSRSEIEAFAVGVSKGSPTYTSVIIVPAEGGAKTTAELKGRTIAYGDTASTSSHLVPRALLEESGLVANRDYKTVYVGAHDAVARSVETGKVAAGALSKPIYESLLSAGKLDPAKTRVLIETRPIPNYPMAMQSKLAPQLKEQIRAAFLGIRDPSILKTFRSEGFVTTNDRAYDVLRDTAKVLNLDLAKLQ